MAEYVKKIRTDRGDMQIDYTALANLPKSDDTLTQSGNFADAKATGDAIKNVSDNLTASLEETKAAMESMTPEDIGALPIGGGSLTGLLEAPTFMSTGDVIAANDMSATSFTESGVRLEDKYVQMRNRTVTLLASGWASVGDIYEQSVVVEGVLSTDNALCDLSMKDATADTAETIQESWCYVGKIQLGNGLITATCYSEIPEVDLTFNLLVLN